MLTLDGAANNLISLRSSTGGQQYTIQNDGAEAVDHVDVQDGNVTGTDITATLSRNSSNNDDSGSPCWVFTASALTWDGSSSTDWNTAANWDEGYVPNTGDNVTIANAGSQPATLGSAVTTNNLTISAGATLSLNAYNTTVNGTFSNDGTLQLNGDETTVALTIDTDSGLTKFVKDTGTIDVKNFGTYYNVEFASSNNAVFRLPGNTQINGAMTVTQGNFNPNGKDLALADGGSVTNNAAWTAPSAGTFTCSGDATFAGTGISFYNFSCVTPNKTLTFAAGSTYNFAGALTLSGDTGNNINVVSSAPDGAGGSHVIFNDTGTENVIYVDVNDVVCTAIDDVLGVEIAPESTGWNFINAVVWTGGAGNTSWNNVGNWLGGVVPNNGENALIVAKAFQPVLDLDLTGANSPDAITINSGATLTLNGRPVDTVNDSFSNSGTIELFGTEIVSDPPANASGSKIIFRGSSNAAQDTIDLPNWTYRNLTINSSDGGVNADIFRLPISKVISEKLVITQGTLSANTFNLGVSDEVTISANGIFSPSSGDHTYSTNVSNSGTYGSGTGEQKFLGNYTQSAGIYSGGNDINTFAGNITVSGGTFTATSGSTALTGTDKTMEVADAATFTHSNGTVTISGGGVTGFTGGFSGADAFNNMTCVTAGKTLRFKNGTTSAIGGTLTLTGASGNLINLRSTNTGSLFTLSFTGAPQTVTYCDIRDCTALTNAGTANTSRNSGNNTNWSFGSVTWDGSSSTAWTTGANWDIGVVPANFDKVVIATATNQPVLGSNVTAYDLTLNTNTTLKTVGYNLTVSNSFTNSGTLEVYGSETISAPTNKPGSWVFFKGTGADDDITMYNWNYKRLRIDAGAADVFRPAANIVLGSLEVTVGIFNTKSTGTDRTLQVTTETTISNAGQLITNTSALTFDGAVSNDGTIDATAGTHTFNAAFRNENTIGVYKGGSGIHAFASTTFNGNGSTFDCMTGTYTFAGDFTNRGTYTGGSGNHTFQGDWANQAGAYTASSNLTKLTKALGSFNNAATFNHGSGTVEVDIAGPSQFTISGDNTFRNFYCNDGGLTLNISNASTQTFTNKLTLTGASGNMIKLNSTGVGQFKFDFTGSPQTVTYVDLEDCDADTNLGYANNCRNSGNNTDWVFGDVSWTGASSTAWTTNTNWSAGMAPTQYDNVIVVKAGSMPPTLAGPTTVNKLTVETVATLNTFGNTLTVSSGFVNNGTLEVNGGIGVTAPTNGPTSRIIYSGGAGQINNWTYYDLILNSGSTLNAPGVALNVLKNFTVSAGTTYDTAQDLTVSGETTIDGVLTPNARALTFNGPFTSSGTVSSGSGNHLFLDDFTVSGGTFTPTSKYMKLSGEVTFNHSGGDFNAAAGTVEACGSGTLTILGSTTFRNFECTREAKVINLSTAGTQTFAGKLRLIGTAGNLISFYSNNPGNVAAITANGGSDVRYTRVKDSTNNGATIYPVFSKDMGNNNTPAGWDFSNSVMTWNGSVSTDWDTDGNWDVGVYPGTYDNVVIDNSAARFPTLNINASVKRATIEVGATVRTNGKNLETSTSLINQGTLEIWGNETTITVPTNSTGSQVVYTGQTGSGDTINIRNWTYRNLKISAEVADTFNLTAALTVYETLEIKTGTLSTNGANALSISGEVLLAGSLSTNTAPFKVDGGITSTGTFSGGSGSHTFSGNITINGGTFTASSGTTTLSGVNRTFDNNTGAGFTHSGTLVLAGTGTQKLQGINTFQNLSCTIPGLTIEIEQVGSQTVAGTFTLTGAVGNLIKITSSSPGNAGPIKINNASNVTYVAVKDSTNSGTAVGATLSTNLGNNSGWTFTNNTVVWDGSASTAWATSDNWNIGVAPSAFDNVKIAAAGNLPATLAANTTVNKLTVEAAATVSLNSRNLTVTSGSFACSGTIELSAGTTVATPSCIAGSLVRYTGGAGPINNWNYRNLYINAALSAATDITVNEDITVASGGFNFGANSLNLYGDFNNPGSGSFALSTVNFLGADTTSEITGSSTIGTIACSAAGKALVFPAGATQTITNFNIAGAGGNFIKISSSTPGAYANINVTNDSVNRVKVKDSNASGGNAIVPTNSSNLGHTLNWDFSNVFVTWNGSAGTSWNNTANWDMGFVPSGSDEVVVSSTLTNKPILDQAEIVKGITIEIGATLDTDAFAFTVTDGASGFINQGTLELDAGTTVTQPTNSTGSLVRYTGGAAAINNWTYRDLTIAGGTASSPANLTVNEDFRISSGSYNAGAFTLTVNGDFTNEATFTGGAGKHTFNGNWRNSGPSYTATSGTTEITSSAVWNNTGGTFTPAGGVVEFTGSGTVEIRGAATFNNLHCTVPGKKMYFQAGATQVINGTLNAQGALGNLLWFRSLTDGAQFTLNFPNGNQTVKYINLKDSNASGGHTYTADTCSNVSNNTGWYFPPTNLTWTGNTSVVWANDGNWDLGFYPNVNDNALIPAGMPRYPVLGSAVILTELTIETSSTVTLNGQNLTIGSKFSNNGTLTLNGSETVTMSNDSDSGLIQYIANTGTVTVPSIGDYYRVEFASTGDAVFRLPASVAATKVTVTQGTCDLQTRSLTLASGGTIELAAASSMTASAGSTVTCSGGATVTCGAGSSLTLKDFVGQGALLVTSTGTTVSFNNAILQGNATFECASNIAFNNVACSGNIAFTGNAATTSFNDFTCATGGRQLKFREGKTYVFNGSLSLQGTAGNLISLRSTTNGSSYNFHNEGNNDNIDFVDVRDSNASGGSGNAITADTSKNSTGNTNWVFTPSLLTWDGSSSTAWDTDANWDLGFRPNNSDSIIIPDTANDPVLSTVFTAGGLTVETGAILNTGTFDFTSETNIFNNGSITSSGGDLEATGNLISAGTLTLGSGNIKVGGTFNSSGPITMGGGDLSVIGAFTNNNTVSLGGGSISVAGLFSNSGTLKLDGGETLALTNDTDSGTIEVVGNAGPYTLDDIGGFYKLALSGNGTYQLSGDITVETLLAVSSGTFAPLTFDITLKPGCTVETLTAGAWTTPTAGTFTCLGNAWFTGDGSAAFFNLHCTEEASTLTFSSGETYPVAGTLTLTGGSSGLSNFIRVRSSSAGVPFILDFTGAPQTVNCVDLMDCTAATSSGTADQSRNSGNNTNWTFTASTLTWNGAAGTDWETAGNWNLGYPPNTTDKAIIANMPNDPILSSDVTISGLTVETGALLTSGGFNLAATGALFNAGSLSSTSGSYNVSGDLTNTGALTSSGGNIVVGGNLGNSGSLNIGGSNLTITGTFLQSGTFKLQGTETVSSAPSSGTGSTIIFTGNNDGNTDIVDLKNWTFKNLLISSEASDTFRLASGLAVGETLEIRSGTLNTLNGANNYSLSVSGETLISGVLSANASTVTLNGGLVNSGTFNGGTGTHSFTGTVANNGIFSSGSGSNTFTAVFSNSATFNGGSGMNRFLAGWTNTGSFTATSGTTEVAGADFTWFNNGGTFTHNNGNVEITGAGTARIYGTNQFQGLMCAVPGKILVFDANDTQTIGRLVLTGAAGNPILVTSEVQSDSSPIAAASSEVSFVSVRDSDNSTGSTITAKYSSNLGNNSNWIFEAITWTGASSTDWNDGSNWSGGVVPSGSDEVVIAATSNQPVLAANTVIGKVSVSTGATLKTDNYNLTVSGGTAGFTVSGTLEVNAGRTVTRPTLNNSSKVIYSGGSGAINNWTYRDLSITGTGTYSLPAALTIAEDLAISSGTLEVAYSLGVSGTFSIAPGSRVNATNNITVTGSTLEVAGTLSSAAALTASGEVRISGSATVSGAIIAGNLTTPGTLSAGSSIASGNDLTVSGAVTAAGTVTIADSLVSSGTITLAGDTSLGGSCFNTGTINAGNGSLSLNGNWTSTGTFNAASSEVVLLGASDAIIAGTTSFWDLTCTIPGKQLSFESGRTQTVLNDLSISGTTLNHTRMSSTTAGGKWLISIPGGPQTLFNVNVQDSDALGNAITCFNSTDSGNNNENWIFSALILKTPVAGKQVGSDITIVGSALPNSEISILHKETNTVIATVETEADGSFLVVTPVTGQPNALPPGIQTIIPVLQNVEGTELTIEVLAANQITPDIIPVFVSEFTGFIAANPLESDSTIARPTVSGMAKPGQTVELVVRNTRPDLGTVSVQTLASVIVPASAEPYVSFMITADNYTGEARFHKGTNEVVVIVDGVASSIQEIYLSSPYGAVIDSVTRTPIKGAMITFYKEGALLNMPGVPPTTLDNPYETDEQGKYEALIYENGLYEFDVDAYGYSYYNAETPEVFASGAPSRTGMRRAPGNGVINVVNAVQRMNILLAPSDTLLDITMSANKSEAVVGEVVTYTVTLATRGP
ncbi:MAG: hypothetical protein PHQ23_04130, partial [Candidatus Wallbacteria bacterium]|nr:hypothetical protein [Candidatus Wallbacteria bacterium]